MSIGERIIDFTKARGVSGVQIGDILGLSKSPLTDWKNGKSKPTLEQITVLCEYFAISSDYLLFGDKPLQGTYEDKTNISDDANNRSEDTSEVLSYYNRLDAESKDYIKGEMVRLCWLNDKDSRAKPLELIEPPTTKKDHSISPQPKGNSSFIQIKERNRQSNVLVPIVGMAAAGLPMEMIENDYGELPTADRSIRAGDFGVIASGDSMIDAGIHDGDVVIIRPQPVVNNGDMALVSVEDGSTIKKVYLYPDRIELVPMNNRHKKQVYSSSDDIRILGKVVTTISPT